VVEEVVLVQLLVDLHLDQQEVLVVEQEMDIQLVLCQEVQVEHMEILVVQAKWAQGPLLVVAVVVEQVVLDLHNLLEELVVLVLQMNMHMDHQTQ
jgi:hypothetical protein